MNIPKIAGFDSKPVQHGQKVSSRVSLHKIWCWYHSETLPTNFFLDVEIEQTISHIYFSRPENCLIVK